MIGYAFCGSFCTHQKSLEKLKELKQKYKDVLPIISENAANTDTRFGSSTDFIKKVTEICGQSPILTIKDAEPLGPKIKLDLLIISPCTGNTLAKLTNGITDTCVTMAAKAHMRNSRPLLISLASNDGLSANLANIGKMMNKKSVFFVPMVQDDVEKKPHSLVADFDLLPMCAELALSQKQMRPVFKTNY